VGNSVLLTLNRQVQVRTSMV